MFGPVERNRILKPLTSVQNINLKSHQSIKLIEAEVVLRKQFVDARVTTADSLKDGECRKDR